MSPDDEYRLIQELLTESNTEEQLLDGSQVARNASAIYAISPIQLANLKREVLNRNG
jgi:hypothetical protein